MEAFEVNQSSVFAYLGMIHCTIIKVLLDINLLLNIDWAHIPKTRNTSNIKILSFILVRFPFVSTLILFYAHSERVIILHAIKNKLISENIFIIVRCIMLERANLEQFDQL